MESKDMPDGRGEMWTGLIVSLILLVAVAVCVGYVAGYEAATKKLHGEAVRADVGEWQTDMDGNVSFHWKRLAKPETDQ
jgi:hypothetical protein